MSDRTSSDPDDYDGTENLRGVLDAWGFEIVTYADGGPSITVRPRDPRFDTMAGHLVAWLGKIGLYQESFTIETFEGLGEIVIRGADDRAVMHDRKHHEIGHINRDYLGHIGTKRACRRAGWASPVEARAWLEYERRHRNRKPVIEALERRLEV